MSDPVVAELLRQIAAMRASITEYGLAGAAGVVTIPPSTVPVTLPYVVAFSEGDLVAVTTTANGDRLILGPVTQP